MNHDAIKEQLFMLTDAEMPQAERLEIERHLQQCPECRARFEDWSKLQGLLNRSQNPRASENFIHSVMERLQNAKTMPQENESSISIPIHLPRWLFPVVGYGIAFCLMISAIQYRQVHVNTASVLMVDVPQSSQWTFGHEKPDMNQLFGS